MTHIVIKISNLAVKYYHFSEQNFHIPEDCGMIHKKNSEKEKEKR